VRTLFALAAIIALAPAARAGVWVAARYYDEKTPLEAVDPNYPTIYRDIMVGTHLTLVISADRGGYWSGQLNMDWDSEPSSILTGRGRIAKPLDYKESCLEAAGQSARVISYNRPEGVGFQFWTTHFWDLPNVRNCVPGDWFIFDYQARQVGACDLALTESDPETGVRTLLQTLSFTHVPSRDFHADTLVDFRDFAKLASRWGSELDADPNNPGAAMDLDADRSIDVNDLAMFNDFWLERTAAPDPPDDPNAV